MLAQGKESGKDSAILRIDKLLVNYNKNAKYRNEMFISKMEYEYVLKTLN